MKNDILYFYGLDANNIIRINQNYHFYVNYQKFILFKTTMDDNTLKDLVYFLSRRSNKFFVIQKALDNKDYIILNKEKYVLLKITSPPNDEILIKELIKNYIYVGKELKQLDRSNWSLLWSKKVDYLEYQISERAINYPIIKDSFSYYVGLAENAIEYFNTIKLNSEHLVLSQKRIKAFNIAIDYYNPLTLIVDYRVRDLAEYIKAEFFIGNAEVLDRIISDNYNFTNNEYNLLFARLLYPSYYFDELTEILENNKDEEALLKYLNKAKDYEQFLKKCLDIFSKRTRITKLDWLL